MERWERETETDYRYIEKIDDRSIDLQIDR